MKYIKDFLSLNILLKKTTIVKVKCITPYTDTQFKKDIVKGSIYEVTKARADELVENDVAEII